MKDGYDMEVSTKDWNGMSPQAPFNLSPEQRDAEQREGEEA